MRNLWKMAILVAIGGGWMACTEEVDTGHNGEVGETGVFIVNEGNFMSVSGDISFYDFESDSLKNNLFLNANGMAAGDVVMDILVLDSTGIISANNSNLLRVFRLSDFALIKTIPIVSPRYLVEVSPDKVYVSSWTGRVFVLDVKTFTFVDSISVGPYPEDMTLLDGRVYVANSSGFGSDHTVSIINVVSQSVERTVTVGVGPATLAADESTHRIYVACTGNEYVSQVIPGSVYVIDGMSLSVVDSMIRVNNGGIQDTIFPSKIAVRGSLGVMISGFAGPIISFDPGSLTATDTISGTFYGVGVNPTDSGDSKIYATTFSLLGRFQIFESSDGPSRDLLVGEFPSGLVFRHGH